MVHSSESLADSNSRSTDQCEICGSSFCSDVGSMCIRSPEWTVVVFSGQGGYDVERDEAKTVLHVGQLYLVDDVDVGSYRSTVSLKGVPGRFNTALFDKRQSNGDRSDEPERPADHMNQKE